MLWESRSTLEDEKAEAQEWFGKKNNHNFVHWEPKENKWRIMSDEDGEANAMSPRNWGRNKSKIHYKDSGRRQRSTE